MSWLIDWLIDWDKNQDQNSIVMQKQTTRNQLEKNNTFKDVVCEVLTEPKNMIRWHGSGATKETLDAICKEWLRIPHHNDIRSTAIGIENNLKNEKKQVQEKQIEQLMNRPHLKCKYIVIVSHPKEYYSKVQHRENDSLLITTDKFWGTDYYKNDNLMVRPEFIKWYFDANKMEFIPNEKYYKKLWKEEQKQLFQEVKKKYMDSVIESKTRLDDYLQMMKKYNLKCPYDEKDIEEYWPYTIVEEELDPYGFPIDYEEQRDNDTNSDSWKGRDRNPKDWE